MILNIPVAWLQLTWQRTRFLVALAGMAFAVVLIFMQLGFQDALYTSATQVHQSLEGDLFLISSQYKSLTSQHSFPRTRLYQTLGFDGVDSVSSLYIEFAMLRNPQTGQKYSISVYGIDLAKPAFNLPEVNQNLNKLKVPDLALFDRDSRLQFGPLAAEFEQGKTVRVEISPYNQLTLANTIEICGLFTIGPSFGVDGNLITSYLTLLRTFSERRTEDIDIGLITLRPGTEPQKVLANLSANLPKDVQIFTKQGFIDLEKNYWTVRTPIGFVFKLMVTMGFIIGIAVVYQILYSNISNHLIEFATLKAMGFKNNYLLGVVFQQALFLAVFGYIPGFAFSLGLYDFAKSATHIPISMGFNKALIVFVLAVVMCLISGAIAMGKLRSADPADIF